MIDFRYHLVSIVAVFLALAIGIVLGSTALQGPVYNALNRTTSQLQNQYEAAASQRNAAQQVVSADNAWFQANEPAVLHGLLAGQKLLIVTEPGFQSSVVSGITTAAADAGATVTGTVALSTKFFDTSNSTQAALETTNSDVAQSAGIQLDSGLSDQQQATAQILAGALLSGSGTAVDAQTTLAAYAAQGFLTFSPVVTAAKATLAVVVTPQLIPADGASDPLAQELGPVVQELAAAAPAVVAGPAAGSGAGSPIAVLRGTSAADQASTVDDADSVLGQITVIQALHNQLAGGKPGAWGQEGDGGPAYPAVTPPASPAAAASPSAAKKART